jgi:hypothetical protein
MELEALAERLKGVATITDVGGEGSSCFLFAKQADRSFELARCDEGWWVESWSGENPVSEQTYRSAEEALRAGQQWLAKHL